MKPTIVLHAAAWKGAEKRPRRKAWKASPMSSARKMPRKNVARDRRLLLLPDFLHDAATPAQGLPQTKQRLAPQR
eukprot:6059260-Lingulodinium_polyedra.AAC.1